MEAAANSVLLGVLRGPFFLQPTSQNSMSQPWRGKVYFMRESLKLRNALIVLDYQLPQANFVNLNHRSLMLIQ
jgi:hypothetical protein